MADLDVKHGNNGFASWRAFLEEAGLQLPEVPYQDTPSGGGTC